MFQCEGIVNVDAIDLSALLTKLQSDLGWIDFRIRTAPSDQLQILLLKTLRIKLRMDANLNHQRPHLHVDYGKNHHTASYALDNGKRLAGNLPAKYDVAVKEWIENNRSALKKIWMMLRTGESPRHVIAELEGSRF